MSKKAEALDILEEGLKELESSKGSITVGVQKLSRASHLLNENNIYAWTQLQLGALEYTQATSKLIEVCRPGIESNDLENFNKSDYDKELEAVKLLHIPIENINEIIVNKMLERSGGMHSVDFIEQKMNNLIKAKKGNDGTYYTHHLQTHLVYIKKYCHNYTSSLISKLKYEGTTKNSFDLLKQAVDDKFLEIDPELAEQLMIAFKSISSNKKEEWSHALTTCRRLLEKLADNLYPATDEKIGDRTFKQNQYINRLWQFMDVSIQSKSNKDLAKAHVDYLGSWLQKNYTTTCKGVHSEVTQLEATKFVFHMYLLLVDLLEYLDDSVITTDKISINNASLDEIESLLNINRNTAKEMIKARVNYGGLTLKQLSNVAGVGAKTIEKAKEAFEF